MRFETSTHIPEEQIAAVEKRLRDAAAQAKHPKFFGATETIEVIVNAKYPPVEELAQRASTTPTPKGDPTACMIAYNLAKSLCGGDSFCQAAAYAAYLICVNS